MAIVFDASADAMVRTATVPTFGDWSFLVWYQGASATADHGVFYLSDDAVPTNYMGCYLNTTGSPDVFDIEFTGGAVAGTTGISTGTSTWYRLALTFNNTSNAYTLYLNGASEATSSAFTGSVTIGRLTIGNVPQGGAFTNGRLANPKLFTSVLTLAECEHELSQYLPRTFSNLWGWWPSPAGASDLVDYSGNGRDLTASGTLTAADGPPIPWRAMRPHDVMRYVSQSNLVTHAPYLV